MREIIAEQYVLNQEKWYGACMARHGLKYQSITQPPIFGSFNCMEDWNQISSYHNLSIKDERDSILGKRIDFSLGSAYAIYVTMMGPGKEAHKKCLAIGSEHADAHKSFNFERELQKFGMSIRHT